MKRLLILVIAAALTLTGVAESKQHAYHTAPRFTAHGNQHVVR